MTKNKSGGGTVSEMKRLKDNLAEYILASTCSKEEIIEVLRYLETAVKLGEIEP